MGRTPGKVPCPKPVSIECSIFSTYSLCSTIPFEELTVQPTSAYIVCVEQEEYLTVSPASTYSLAVA